MCGAVASGARYYVTASYLRDNGNLYNNPDTDYSTNIHLTRYNFRSNIDMTLTKTTTLALEIGANMTDAHQPRTVTANNNYQSQATELFTMSYKQDPISTPVRVPLGYDEFGKMEWGWAHRSRLAWVILQNACSVRDITRPTGRRS